MWMFIKDVRGVAPAFTTRIWNGLNPLSTEVIHFWTKKLAELIITA
jgi:hypothetical protein